MNKTVILSTNDNDSYFKYYPYTTAAWNRFGWKTLTFYLGDRELKSTEENLVVKLNPVAGFMTVTVVQVSRLFGHKYCKGFIMTSDMDMIPLSNYWNPNPGEITCYGHDLNDYQQIPMCYIAMSDENWEKVIPEKSIEELLKKYPCAVSSDWMTCWTTDQTIITDRLSKINHVNVERGKVNGIAVGRIDKICWEESLRSPGMKIDCHVPRVFDFKQIEEIVNFIV